MRVAMVVEELAPVVGIEEALVTLAAALRPLGCEPVVLVCQPPARGSPYLQRLQAAEVEVCSLPPALRSARDRVDGLREAAAALVLLAALPLTAAVVLGLAVLVRWPFARTLQAVTEQLRPWMPARPLARLAWALYLRGWCWQRRIDLVHVHGYGCGASPAWALFAAAGTGRPVLYSEHGLPWPELRADPDICRDLERARRLIAVSREAAQALRDVCPDAPPADVIHHVVADGEQREGARPARDGLVFGCAARLSPPKGHLHWVRSMPAVLQAVPGSRFVLAGEGSERAGLQSEAEALGVRAQVDFLGLTPNADLRALMRTAWDAFVLPSLEEPLGIAVVEAMAAGLPIVATAAGGVLDLVRDEETALLVPPGDSAALAAAQVRLAQDADLRARLGRQARQAYLDGPFTPEAVGRATHHCYRAAL